MELKLFHQIQQFVELLFNLHNFLANMKDLLLSFLI